MLFDPNCIELSEQEKCRCDRLAEIFGLTEEQAENCELRYMLDKAKCRINILMGCQPDVATEPVMKAGEPNGFASPIPTHHV